MTENEWIVAGRPHWQCYSCRQIFVSIPIPARFICSLCLDKDNTPTPLISKNTVGEVDTVRNFSENKFQEVEATADCFLECTEDHPVYALAVGASSWHYFPAEDLLPDDLLLGADGSSYRVESIEVLPDIPEFVYNLETFPSHNFFANGVLVHNCDDPIDPKRAVSEAELKTAADFVTNILPSRKVDKAVAVTTVIMQRLHSEDPTGILLAKAKQIGGVERIRHICLPARLADNVLPATLRDKYTEGLMDPDRLPEVVLREQEILLGAYAFSGQYQQSPVPLTGGMFNISYFSNRVKAAPYDCVRIRYWDRACLVKNTLIETIAGPKPIQDIRKDDLVLTRQGYKRVRWAGETKKTSELVTVRFSNGSEITGTPDHLVWTENRGWISLALLNSSDKVVTTDLVSPQGETAWLATAEDRNPTQKQSFLKESPIHGDRAGNTTKPTGTTRNASGTGTIPCTEPPGVSITATFPRAATFITWTETGTIIRSRTLNVYPPVSTCAGTPVAAGMTFSATQKSLTPTSSVAARPAKECSYSRSGRVTHAGSVKQLSGRSTATPSGYATALNVAVSVTATDHVNEPVAFVAKHSWELLGPSTVPSVTVPRVAKSLQVLSLTQNDWRTYIRSWPLGASNNLTDPTPVNVVVNHSSLGTLIQNGSSGALAIAEIRAVPVYDISVEGAHEFFANGVLVHNSTQDGGCYTAGVLLAKSPEGDYYIEHVRHGQWEPDRRNQEMKACAVRDRARYGPQYEPLIYIEAEGGSSGRDSYKGVLRALAGFSVREHRPTGRKEVRAEPWSCQLASGNVHIVDSGSADWDIEGFIQEHIHFPLGKYLDQVDASSGAFALLTQQRPAGGLRSYRLQHHRKQGLQVILCSPEQLTGLELTRRCLLVFLKDPETVKEVMSDAEGVSGLHDSSHRSGQPLVCAQDKPLGKGVMSTVRNGSQSGDREGQEEASRAGCRVEEQGKEVVPTHSLPAVLDSLTLDFLPNSPADFQESWDAVLPDYGTTAEGLLLTRDKAKRFWAFTTRHRDPWAEAVVLVDDNEQRLLAAGLACCDGLGLPRADTLAWTGRDSWQASRETKAETMFIYEQLRIGRNLVV